MVIKTQREIVGHLLVSQCRDRQQVLCGHGGGGAPPSKGGEDSTRVLWGETMYYDILQHYTTFYNVFHTIVSLEYRLRSKGGWDDFAYTYCTCYI